jgi:putative tricarboxylic transport membrane protein
MSHSTEHSGGHGPSQRGVEIGVAVFLALLGLITIIGSLQVGIDWGLEGPKAGFFPFYLGVLIVIASIINFVQIMMTRSDVLFAEWSQLKQVLAVVVPTTVYVAFILYIGIYAASVLLIAIFMKWLGRYRWSLAISVSVGVTVLNYLLFEKWFLVPLPKGPLEDFFGL